MKHLRAMVVLPAMLGLVACDTGEQRSTGEDLTIVVEADRSKISQEEQRLRERLEAFEAERKRLREEKAEMMAEKEKLQGLDKAAIQRLKEAERRLWEKERAMWSKEAALDRQRQELAASKDDLISKVATKSTAPASPGGAARLEASLARIERSLKQRPAASGTGGLAGRLEKLEGRIERIEGRLDEILAEVKKAGGGRTVVVPRPVSGGGRVRPKEAARAFTRATRKMKRNGILWGDLPAELAGLQAEYRAARKAKDFGRAKEAAGQLDAALAAMVIDSGFIDRKFNRLNALIKQRPPKDKQAVSALLRKATQLVGDGKYQAANRELNRIFALLGS